MSEQPELELYRKSIDRLDNAICALIAERFNVTQKVGEYKAIHNLPAIDEVREKQQFEKISAIAEQYGLDGEFATKFLRIVIDEVVKNHREIAQKTH